MDSHNPVLTPTFLLFLWIVVSSSSCSEFPIAKQGCQDHCGNVSIPFPFGTEQGCYLHEQFFIKCNNSVDPILGKNVDITEISLEGQLTVLFPIGYSCYNPENDTISGSNISSMWLSDIYTFNSTLNKFTTVGCDTYAIVTGRRYESIYTTGCLSMCIKPEDVFDGSCSGIGCCQTSIPDGAWKINVSVDFYDNHSSVLNFSPCSYAFVVEESKLQFYAENITNINKDLGVPVAVDWVVEYNVKCEEAKTNRSSYACVSEGSSECVDEATGYRCRCKDGFEGNPYLRNGCRDIDECANSNVCIKNNTCHNTQGSYYCKCNEGYHSYYYDETYMEVCIDDVPPQKTFYSLFIAVGSCAIVIVLSYLWYSKLMTMKEDSLREEYFRKNGGFLLQEKLNASQRDANSYSIRIFTADELQKATNDFDNTKIIGQGGFGTVFKGKLIDETIVAIKKSRGVDQGRVEQFINEVILLSRINNRNVVKLLGCCLETEMPLLVYEFINNGTLLEHLKGMIGNHESKFTWNIRLRIASQVAGVLFYLHSYASPQIIHRDIKSSNILLDQDYMAKVADFGISRLVSMDENQLSTLVQGTPGYLDPEYMHTGVLTEKSDVYSFGVVLIELLTAKKVFSTDRTEEERFLASYFLHQLNNDNLLGVLDHNMGYNIENCEQIKEVAMIAKKCISMKGEYRPYMKEVLRDLETLEMQGHNYVSNALEKDSRDQCEDSDGKKLSKACGSSDGHPSTFASCDISPVSTTAIEHMLPVASGR